MVAEKVLTEWLGIESEESELSSPLSRHPVNLQGGEKLQVYRKKAMDNSQTLFSFF